MGHFSYSPALDLLRYPQESGGIAHVATVLPDLGGSIGPEQLSAFSLLIERPVVQRLWHLLERLGHDALTAPMRKGLLAGGSPPWYELDQQQVRDPDFALKPMKRSPRWRVIMWRAPKRKVCGINGTSEWNSDRRRKWTNSEYRPSGKTPCELRYHLPFSVEFYAYSEFFQICQKSYQIFINFILPKFIDYPIA